jgi:hypothetical protein
MGGIRCPFCVKPQAAIPAEKESIMSPTNRRLIRERIIIRTYEEDEDDDVNLPNDEDEDDEDDDSP